MIRFTLSLAMCRLVHIVYTQNQALNALQANIHNYFIAKSLEKICSLGIVAVITSKETMDKSNSKMGQRLAERAELISILRLSNNAFDHAKIKVITDILFFQKHKRKIKTKQALNQTYDAFSTDYGQINDRKK